MLQESAWGILTGFDTPYAFRPDRLNMVIEEFSRNSGITHALGDGGYADGTVNYAERVRSLEDLAGLIDELRYRITAQLFKNNLEVPADGMVARLGKLDALLLDIEQIVFPYILRSKTEMIQDWDRAIAYLNENQLQEWREERDQAKRDNARRLNYYQSLLRDYELASQSTEADAAAQEDAAFFAIQRTRRGLMTEVEDYLNQKGILQVGSFPAGELREQRRRERQSLVEYFAKLMFESGKTAQDTVEFGHSFPLATSQGAKDYLTTKTAVVHEYRQFRFYERLYERLDAAKRTALPAPFSPEFTRIFLDEDFSGLTNVTGLGEEELSVIAGTELEDREVANIQSYVSKMEFDGWNEPFIRHLLVYRLYVKGLIKESGSYQRIRDLDPDKEAEAIVLRLIDYGPLSVDFDKVPLNESEEARLEVLSEKRFGLTPQKDLAAKTYGVPLAQLTPESIEESLQRVRGIGLHEAMRVALKVYDRLKQAGLAFEPAKGRVALDGVLPPPAMHVPAELPEDPAERSKVLEERIRQAESQNQDSYFVESVLFHVMRVLNTNFIRTYDDLSFDGRENIYPVWPEHLQAKLNQAAGHLKDFNSAAEYLENYREALKGARIGGPGSYKSLEAWFQAFAGPAWREHLDDFLAMQADSARTALRDTLAQRLLERVPQANRAPPLSGALKTAFDAQFSEVQESRIRELGRELSGREHEQLRQQALLQFLVSFAPANGKSFLERFVENREKFYDTEDAAARAGLQTAFTQLLSDFQKFLADRGIVSPVMQEQLADMTFRDTYLFSFTRIHKKIIQTFEQEFMQSGVDAEKTLQDSKFGVLKMIYILQQKRTHPAILLSYLPFVERVSQPDLDKQIQRDVLAQAVANLEAVLGAKGLVLDKADLEALIRESGALEALFENGSLTTKQRQTFKLQKLLAARGIVLDGAREINPAFNGAYTTDLNFLFKFHKNVLRPHKLSQFEIFVLFSLNAQKRAYRQELGQNDSITDLIGTNAAYRKIRKDEMTGEIAPETGKGRVGYVKDALDQSSYEAIKETIERKMALRNDLSREFVLAVLRKSGVNVANLENEQQVLLPFTEDAAIQVEPFNPLDVLKQAGAWVAPNTLTQDVFERMAMRIAASNLPLASDSHWEVRADFSIVEFSGKPGNPELGRVSLKDLKEEQTLKLTPVGSSLGARLLSYAAAVWFSAWTALLFLGLFGPRRFERAYRLTTQFVNHLFGFLGVQKNWQRWSLAGKALSITGATAALAFSAVLSPFIFAASYFLPDRIGNSIFGLLGLSIPEVRSAKSQGDKVARFEANGRRMHQFFNIILKGAVVGYVLYLLSAQSQFLILFAAPWYAFMALGVVISLVTSFYLHGHWKRWTFGTAVKAAFQKLENAGELWDSALLRTNLAANRNAVTRSVLNVLALTGAALAVYLAYPLALSVSWIQLSFILTSVALVLFSHLYDTKQQQLDAGPLKTKLVQALPFLLLGGWGGLAVFGVTPSVLAALYAVFAVVSSLSFKKVLPKIPLLLFVGATVWFAYALGLFAALNAMAAFLFWLVLVNVVVGKYWQQAGEILKGIAAGGTYAHGALDFMLAGTGVLLVLFGVPVPTLIPGITGIPAMLLWAALAKLAALAATEGYQLISKSSIFPLPPIEQHMPFWARFAPPILDAAVLGGMAFALTLFNLPVMGIAGVLAGYGLYRSFVLQQIVAPSSSMTHKEVHKLKESIRGALTLLAISWHSVALTLIYVIATVSAPQSYALFIAIGGLMYYYANIVFGQISFVTEIFTLMFPAETLPRLPEKAVWLDLAALGTAAYFLMLGTPQGLFIASAITAGIGAWKLLAATLTARSREKSKVHFFQAAVLDLAMPVVMALSILVFMSWGAPLALTAIVSKTVFAALIALGVIKTFQLIGAIRKEPFYDMETHPLYTQMQRIPPHHLTANYTPSSPWTTMAAARLTLQSVLSGFQSAVTFVEAKPGEPYMYPTADGKRLKPHPGSRHLSLLHVDMGHGNKWKVTRGGKTVEEPTMLEELRMVLLHQSQFGDSLALFNQNMPTDNSVRQAGHIIKQGPEALNMLYAMHGYTSPFVYTSRKDMTQARSPAQWKSVSRVIESVDENGTPHYQMENGRPALRAGSLAAAHEWSLDGQLRAHFMHEGHEVILNFGDYEINDADGSIDSGILELFMEDYGKDNEPAKRYGYRQNRLRIKRAGEAGNGTRYASQTRVVKVLVNETNAAEWFYVIDGDLYNPDTGEKVALNDDYEINDQKMLTSRRTGGRLPSRADDRGGFLPERLREEAHRYVYLYKVDQKTDLPVYDANGNMQLVEQLRMTPGGEMYRYGGPDGLTLWATLDDLVPEPIKDTDKSQISFENYKLQPDGTYQAQLKVNASGVTTNEVERVRMGMVLPALSEEQRITDKINGIPAANLEKFTDRFITTEHGWAFSPAGHNEKLPVSNVIAAEGSTRLQWIRHAESGDAIYWGEEGGFLEAGAAGTVLAWDAEGHATMNAEVVPAADFEEREVVHEDGSTAKHFIRVLRNEAGETEGEEDFGPVESVRKTSAGDYIFGGNRMQNGEAKTEGGKDYVRASKGLILSKNGHYQISMELAAAVYDPALGTDGSWRYDLSDPRKVQIRHAGGVLVSLEPGTYEVRPDGNLYFYAGLYHGGILDWKARQAHSLGAIVNPFLFHQNKTGRETEWFVRAKDSNVERLQKEYDVRWLSTDLSRTRDASGALLQDTPETRWNPATGKFEPIVLVAQPGQVVVNVWGELVLPETAPPPGVRWFKGTGPTILVPRDGWMRNQAGQAIVRGSNEPSRLYLEEAQKKSGIKGYRLNEKDGWEFETIHDGVSGETRYFAVRRDPQDRFGDPLNPAKAQVMASIELDPAAPKETFVEDHIELDPESKMIQRTQEAAFRETFAAQFDAHGRVSAYRLRRFLETEGQRYESQEILRGSKSSEGVLFRQSDGKVITYDPALWTAAGSKIRSRSGVELDLAEGALVLAPAEFVVDAQGYLRVKQVTNEDALLFEKTPDGRWLIGEGARERIRMTRNGQRVEEFIDVSRHKTHDTDSVALEIDERSGDLRVKQYLGRAGKNRGDLTVDTSSKEVAAEGYLIRITGYETNAEGEEYPVGTRLQLTPGQDTRFGHYILSSEGDYVINPALNTPEVKQRSIHRWYQSDDKVPWYSGEEGEGGAIQNMEWRWVMDDLYGSMYSMFQPYIDYPNWATGFSKLQIWPQNMMRHFPLVWMWSLMRVGAAGKMAKKPNNYLAQVIFPNKALFPGIRCHDFGESLFACTAFVMGMKIEGTIRIKPKPGEGFMAVGEYTTTGHQVQLARTAGWARGDLQFLERDVPVFFLWMAMRGFQPFLGFQEFKDRMVKNVWNGDGPDYHRRKDLSDRFRGFLSERNFYNWLVWVGIPATLVPGLVQSARPLISNTLFGIVMAPLIGAKFLIPALQKIFIPRRPGHTVANILSVAAGVLGFAALFKALFIAQIMTMPAFAIFLILTYFSYNVIAKRLFSWYSNQPKPSLGLTASFARILGKTIFLAAALAVLFAGSVGIQFVLGTYIAAYFAWFQQALYSIRAAWWLYFLMAPMVGDEGLSHVAGFVAIVGVLHLGFYLNHILLVLLVTRFLRDVLRETDKSYPKLKGNFLYNLIRYPVEINFLIMRDAYKTVVESIKNTSLLLTLLIITPKRNDDIIFQHVNKVVVVWKNLVQAETELAPGLPPTFARIYENSAPFYLLDPLKQSSLIHAGVASGFLDPALFFRGGPIYTLSWILGPLLGWYESHSGGSVHYNSQPFLYQREYEMIQAMHLYYARNQHLPSSAEIIKKIEGIVADEFPINFSINQFGVEKKDRDRARLYLLYLTTLNLPGAADQEKDPALARFRENLKRRIAQFQSMEPDEQDEARTVSRLQLDWESEWDRLPELVRVEILNDIWNSGAERADLIHYWALNERRQAQAEIDELGTKLAAGGLAGPEQTRLQTRQAGLEARLRLTDGDLALEKLRFIDALAQVTLEAGPRRFVSFLNAIWDAFYNLVVLRVLSGFGRVAPVKNLMIFWPNYTVAQKVQAIDAALTRNFERVPDFYREEIMRALGLVKEGNLVSEAEALATAERMIAEGYLLSKHGTAFNRVPVRNLDRYVQSLPDSERVRQRGPGSSNLAGALWKLRDVFHDDRAHYGEYLAKDGNNPDETFGSFIVEGNEIYGVRGAKDQAGLSFLINQRSGVLKAELADIKTRKETGALAQADYDARKKVLDDELARVTGFNQRFTDFMAQINKTEARTNTLIRIRLLERAVEEARTSPDFDGFRAYRQAYIGTLDVLLAESRKFHARKQNILFGENLFKDPYGVLHDAQALKVFNYFAGYDVTQNPEDIAESLIPPVFPAKPAAGQAKVYGGVPARDPNTNAFKEFGTPQLSERTSGGYPNESTVMPVSAAKMLAVAPQDGAAALAALAADSQLYDARFGFKDSKDTHTGAVSEPFVADNKTILIDLANAVTEGAVRNLFMNHPLLAHGRELLAGAEFKELPNPDAALVTGSLNQAPLTAAEKTRLTQMAAREWAWWAAVAPVEVVPAGTPASYRLPPDHTTGGVVNRANYVGLSALGFYALSIVSAQALGFIQPDEAIDRLASLVAKLNAMRAKDQAAAGSDPAEGLLVQWHNPDTLEPANPDAADRKYFQSAVDTGWLLSGLIVAEQFLSGLGATGAAAAGEIKTFIDSTRLERLLDGGKFIVTRDPRTKKPADGSRYGLFATEILPAVLIAAGKRAAFDTPEEKTAKAKPFNDLGKPVVKVRLRDTAGKTESIATLGSTGGSVLEHLFPLMVLDASLSPRGLARAVSSAAVVIKAVAQPARAEMRTLSQPALGGARFEDFVAPELLKKANSAKLSAPDQAQAETEIEAGLNRYFEALAQDERLAALRQLLLQEQAPEFGRIFHAVDALFTVTSENGQTFNAKSLLPIRGAVWKNGPGPDDYVHFQTHHDAMFAAIQDLLAGRFSNLKARFESIAHEGTLDTALSKLSSALHALPARTRVIFELGLALHDVGRFVSTGPRHPKIGAALVPSLLKSLGGLTDAEQTLLVNLTGQELEFGAMPFGETVPAKLKPEVLELMPFIYFADVASVSREMGEKMGRLTDIHLLNAETMAKPENVADLIQRWPVIRWAGLLQHEGYLDLAHATRDEVPSEFQAFADRHLDFSAHFTFQKFVKASRPMAAQNSENVLRLLTLITPLYESPERNADGPRVEFFGFSTDEFASKWGALNDFLSSLPPAAQLEGRISFVLNRTAQRLEVQDAGKAVLAYADVTAQGGVLEFKVETFQRVRSELRHADAGRLAENIRSVEEQRTSIIPLVSVSDKVRQMGDQFDSAVARIFTDRDMLAKLGISLDGVASGQGAVFLNYNSNTQSDGFAERVHAQLLNLPESRRLVIVRDVQTSDAAWQALSHSSIAASGRVDFIRELPAGFAALLDERAAKLNISRAAVVQVISDIRYRENVPKDKDEDRRRTEAAEIAAVPLAQETIVLLGFDQPLSGVQKTLLSDIMDAASHEKSFAESA